MELQQEYIDGLIAKCLSREASDAEKNTLKDWLTDSVNAKYYNEVERIYEITGHLVDNKEIDTHGAWNKFKEQAEKKQPVEKKLWASLYARAAAILLIAGMGYFIYHQFNKTESQKELTIASTVNTLDYTLPDGTFVSLFSKSAITYKPEYNKQNREVWLNGGAYFKVQHNESLPFMISIGKLFIKDIGTSFTVQMNPVDSNITVNVKEGEVALFTKQDSGITLTKNETGIYNAATGIVSKNDKPDNEVVKLSFEGTELQKVVDTLNKVYKVNIVLACDSLKTIKLSASFAEKNITPIIETIAQTFDLSVSQNKESIVLDSKRCKK